MLGGLPPRKSQRERLLEAKRNAERNKNWRFPPLAKRKVSRAPLALVLPIVVASNPNDSEIAGERE